MPFDRRGVRQLEFTIVEKHQASSLGVNQYPDSCALCDGKGIGQSSNGLPACSQTHGIADKPYCIPIAGSVELTSHLGESRCHDSHKKVLACRAEFADFDLPIRQSSLRDLSAAEYSVPLRPHTCRVDGIRLRHEAEGVDNCLVGRVRGSQEEVETQHYHQRQATILRVFASQGLQGRLQGVHVHARTASRKLQHDVEGLWVRIDEERCVAVARKPEHRGDQGDSLRRHAVHFASLAADIQLHSLLRLHKLLRGHELPDRDRPRRVGSTLCAQVENNSARPDRGTEVATDVFVGNDAHFGVLSLIQTEHRERAGQRGGVGDGGRPCLQARGNALAMHGPNEHQLAHGLRSL
mmetsp:Transcript_85548/g.276044  ORF Transcript_85548/g.276044 Transcript_85548/m.276044 type:complete len:351 (+) Transcript_85548:226-1278(+)